MSDGEERLVSGLRVRIDRTLCVGFGDCIKEAPEGFKLDGDGVAVFVDPDGVARDRLLPVDAISVWDSDGKQLVPSPA